MRVLREGQETFIDPLFPYANTPGGPLLDFGIHIVIFAVEIAAFVVVYKIAKQDNAILNDVLAKE